MNHTTSLRRSARVLLAGAFAMGGAVAIAMPASAGHVAPCMVVTADTTLTEDVAGCTAHGIVVQADDVTLDLNGHTVSAEQTPFEQVGILLAGVTGVTVTNGTVTGFDAGVSIEGGGGNTVRDISAVNNVNDQLQPYEFASGEAVENQPDVVSGDVSIPQWLGDMLCNYGDGITTFDSDDNVIRNNTVTGNGPYGGITMVGDSNGNHVLHNQVRDNNIPNTRADGTNGLCGAMNPGVAGMQAGRTMQAIGIRMEGPGANDNMIQKNRVDNSGLVGISVHAYVCAPTDPGHPPQLDNSGNTIDRNTVTRTGMDVEDPYATGIDTMAQGPTGRVTCPSPNTTITNNTVVGNLNHGIGVREASSDNVVSGNVSNNNGGSGLFVAELGDYSEDSPLAGVVLNNVLTDNKAHNNGQDATDENDDCGTNTWDGNKVKSTNQDCIG